MKNNNKLILQDAAPVFAAVFHGFSCPKNGGSPKKPVLEQFVPACRNPVDRRAICSWLTGPDPYWLYHLLGSIERSG